MGYNYPVSMAPSAGRSAWGLADLTGHLSAVVIKKVLIVRHAGSMEGKLWQVPSRSRALPLTKGSCLPQLETSLRVARYREADPPEAGPAFYPSSSLLLSLQQSVLLLFESVSKQARCLLIVHLC